MRVVIIGGSGHIGSYLTPRLVESGLSVVNVSRSQRKPYSASAAWRLVEQVVIDRTEEEKTGTFGARIRDLKPDVVVDITCYLPESAQQIVEALRGRVSHFLHCGTIWVHGKSTEVPTTEDQAREPFGDYGCHKAEIEAYLWREARVHGFPATILHPGHLVGRGWIPINPAGNFSIEVFERLANGEEACLPNEGRETLHHVHADDVAQAFQKCIFHRSVCLGESFHIVSPTAVTLFGYARAVASWFGHEAHIRYLPWEEWRKTVSEKDAQITLGHLARSSNCSIEKARRLIEYQPRYSSLEAVKEAISSLLPMNHG